MPRAAATAAVIPFDQLPDAAVVRLPTVLALVGVSRATWWNGIKSGRFPKQIQIGPHMVGWRVSDVRALLAALQPRETA